MKTFATRATLFAKFAVAVVLGSAIAAAAVGFDDALIRAKLTARLPNTLPRIDQISRTPMKGLYEVRIGNDIFYTDESGDYLIHGELIDTAQKKSVTQARIDQLTAINVSQLRMADAIAIRQGTGARDLIVFADPNCVYCKRFEKELATLKDVTIHTFLIPILGGDSPEKSRDLWCTRDPGKAWREWMLDGTRAEHAAQNCDSSAVDRNLALSKDRAIRGTPTVLYANGVRAPGLVSASQIDKLLDTNRRER